MDDMRSIIREISEEEKALLEQRNQQIRPTAFTTMATSASASVLAVLVVAVAVWFIRRDIIVRRRTEEELQASKARFAGILEIAEDAIVSVDVNQKIILFNRGAERAFGYDAEEVLGKSLELLIPTRFVAMHQQHMADFAKSGQQARRMGQRNEVYGLARMGPNFPSMPPSPNST